jgi:hypothetical protein
VYGRRPDQTPEWRGRDENSVLLNLQTTCLYNANLRQPVESSRVHSTRYRTYLEYDTTLMQESYATVTNVYQK